jgi:hypothetical protein
VIKPGSPNDKEFFSHATEKAKRKNIKEPEPFCVSAPNGRGQ